MEKLCNLCGKTFQRNSHLKKHVRSIHEKIPYDCTGKSLSETLILGSIYPQCDKTLFIDLPVKYMKTTSSEHVVHINCSECQNKKQFVYTTSSEFGIFMYWTRNSMNNLSSYCGLVDTRISASDKDLPVTGSSLESNFKLFDYQRDSNYKIQLKNQSQCQKKCFLIGHHLKMDWFFFHWYNYIIRKAEF